jgi:hypothetical protein
MNLYYTPNCYAYTGPCNVAGLQALTKLLDPTGKGLFLGAIDFGPHDTWSNWFNSLNWCATTWTQASIPFVLSVPLRCDESAPESEIADSFSRLAIRLIALGRPTNIIRLGWEHNGTWYPWGSSKLGNAAFIAAYRAAVAAMRSVQGAGFRFDWCVAEGYDWCGRYPGDDVVDYISCDVYNGKIGPMPEYNIHVLLSYAEILGKEVGIPEWGTQTDDSVWTSQMMSLLYQPGINAHYQGMWFPTDPAGDYGQTATALPNTVQAIRSVLRL